MHLTSSGHSDISSLAPRRPRRAPTATSLAMRDDFDAYTYTESPHDLSADDEVFDRDRARFVSYHRAEMGNLLLDDDSGDPDGDRYGEVEMDVYQHQPKPRGRVSSGGGRTGRGIGDEGTMECIGRRYTTMSGSSARKEAGKQKRYELVERKILEDGPERTVSVWREEVAKSAAGSAAGSVVGDPDPAEESPMTHLDSGHRPGRTAKAFGPLGYAHTGSATSSRRPSDVRSPSWEHHQVRAPQTPHPLPSPPPSNPTSHSTSAPRSPPLHHPRPPLPNSPHLRPSTTTSNLTTLPTTLTLAGLLATPTPPLTHLLPTLARLGITQPAHLAALARMGEEVRDREVRAVALREGVSVFEWALVVDLGRGV